MLNIQIGPTVRHILLVVFASAGGEVTILSLVYPHHLPHRVCRTAGGKEDRSTAYSFATE